MEENQRSVPAAESEILSDEKEAPFSVCPESLRGFRSETYSFLGFQNVMSATVDVAEEMEGYRSAVTRYIHYLVRNTAEAEDFVQETFLRAQRQQARRFARRRRSRALTFPPFIGG